MHSAHWKQRNEKKKYVEKWKRKYVSERYPGLCEVAWMCEIHFLAKIGCEIHKKRANERGRVKSKVMKKKVSRKHEILFYFLQFISVLCARAIFLGHIGGWEYVRPLCRIFLVSATVHAWFISTVYRLHERCSTKCRCLHFTYVCMHARTEMVFSRDLTHQVQCND